MTCLLRVKEKEKIYIEHSTSFVGGGARGPPRLGAASTPRVFFFFYAEFAKSLTLPAAHAPALWKNMVMKRPLFGLKPPAMEFANESAGLSVPP